MIEVVKYTSDKKKEWNEFVDKAKNGTFLFKRDYMEYHSDRFNDYSVLLYQKNHLLAIFPANINGQSVYSHQGLTFGGLLYDYATKSNVVASCFESLNTFLKNKGIHTVIYKSIPQIYKSHIGQEDEYFMFLLQAKEVSCKLSSVVDLSQETAISRNRIRNSRKAKEIGVEVLESDDFRSFWKIMELNLSAKYNASPVHTYKEMTLLKSRFPNHIKLFHIKKENSLLGGAVIFLFNNVVKVQYAHANEIGKKLGAIDLFYFYLMEEFKDKQRYLDFGSSNLDSGRILQSSLLNQKEGFGARGVINNIYQYSTDSDFS